MENRYLSIDCTKIRSISKQIKISRNELMQLINSNNHSPPIFPKPCPQTGRFGTPVRVFIYLGISKMVFTF